MDNAAIAAPTRILIADDEPLARELLKRLVAAATDFEVAGECRDGAEVVAAVEALKPDVIFMDVQMPNLTGIEAALQVRKLDPVIVFVTAYEEHAIEAFAARGFQYLVKPVNKKIFGDVLSDVSREVRRRRIERLYNSTSIGESDRDDVGESDQLQFIRVRSGSQIHIVDIQSVHWFEAANQYVRIHSARGEFLISSASLNALEKKLDPKIFVRAHRSALVNRKFVKKVRSEEGAYVAELVSGERIRISRRNKLATAEALLRPDNS